MLKSSVTALAAEQKEMVAALQSHDRQLVELRTQYGEIIRRLDRIERRLER